MEECQVLLDAVFWPDFISGLILGMALLALAYQLWQREKDES